MTAAAASTGTAGWAEVANEVDHVLNVIIEIEAARHHRYFARVAPVRDVGIVFREHCFHGAAQQCREVSRHGRNNQHLGVIALAAHCLVAFEVDEVAKWLAQHHFLLDRRRLPQNRGLIDAEFRFAVAVRQAFENPARSAQWA